uniref:ribosomal protein L5 n=1 Tax=Grateloupia elliptica TaxID=118371 RepID=UPI002028A138|nr:ribosomal protein L5 [Grateloupia elliptica]UQJ72539.1 ribosomal protein L5 [Grateloupia elliptica]UYI31695.1 ribosomal protein L5 [Grateloupia elliptica]
MRSIRLKLHYRYLANFDFMDKESQSTKNLINIPKLDTLVVWPKLNQINFEKNVALKVLVLELLGNQKILIKNFNQKFSEKLLFKLTFRKDNLFSFLDSCLNTIFLHERKFWVWDNIQVEDKLHFYLNNNLANTFNMVPARFMYSLQLPNPFILLNQRSKDRSFYLIPVSKAKDRRIA